VGGKPGFDLLSEDQLFLSLCVLVGLNLCSALEKQSSFRAFQILYKKSFCSNSRLKS